MNGDRGVPAGRWGIEGIENGRGCRGADRRIEGKGRFAAADRRSEREGLRALRLQI